MNVWLELEIVVPGIEYFPLLNIEIDDDGWELKAVELGEGITGHPADFEKVYHKEIQSLVDSYRFSLEDLDSSYPNDPYDDAVERLAGY